MALLKIGVLKTGGIRFLGDCLSVAFDNCELDAGYPELGDADLSQL